MPRDLEGFNPITGATIKLISSLSTLERLRLEYPLTNKDLKELSDLDELTHLHLTVDMTFDDKAGSYLSNFKKLEELSLEGARAIGDTTLKAIGRLKTLKSLRIVGALERPNMFSPSSYLTTPMHGNYVKSAGERALGAHFFGMPNFLAVGSAIRGWGKLKSLEQIHVESFEGLKDVNVAAGVQGMKSLKLVSFYACMNVGNATANALSKLDKVESISVPWCALGAEGMTALAKMGSLKSLSADYNHTINNKALAAISNSESLENLHFLSRGVTSKGVAALAKLKGTLKNLSSFNNMRHISAEAVANLRAAMPNTTIK